MAATSDLLGLARTAQAAALLGENVKLAKKKDKSVKDFLKVGTENIIGTNLIKIQADIAAGF